MLGALPPPPPAPTPLNSGSHMTSFSRPFADLAGFISPHITKGQGTRLGEAFKNSHCLTRYMFIGEMCLIKHEYGIQSLLIIY